MNRENGCNTFSPPRVHSITVRQRLYSLLDAARNKLLITVQGQAAQGKSTLVASYLTHYSCERNAVWLHLSSQESHHTNLFNMLVKALSQHISLTHTECAIERLNPFSPTLGAGEEISRQIDTLRAFFLALPSHLTVVFDNYESLDTDASSHTLFQNIIDILVKHENLIQLIIISRKRTPLDMSKLEMADKSLLLKGEELAFTLEETKIFFKERNLFQLPSKTVEKIQNSTNGWAGGLVLIAEYLERGGDITPLPNHLTAETMDYFTHEVYALLPHSIQQFLIRAALFDEIDADIAQKISVTNNLCSEINSDKILNYLEEHNLFIQRMTGRDQNIDYRFNRLFRSYLIKMLEESLSPHDLKLLNIQVAQFFEQRGEKERAVGYYLDGEAYQKAADMIKRCAVDLIVKGEFPNLQQWIEALPSSIVQEDPWLICYLAITWRVKGGKKNVHNLMKALAMFQTRGNIRGTMLCIAYLIEAGVFIRKSSQKISEWITQGEELLSNLGNSPILSWSRAVLWQQIAFGYIAGEINVQKGLSACQNARLLAKQIDNREINLNASIIMAFGHVRAGNCSEAGKELKSLQGVADERVHPEYRALNLLVKIDLELKRGNFKKAEKFLSESEADLEKFGLIFLYPNFIELKAMHSIYTGKFETARHLAEHLADFSILSGNTFYLALSYHIKSIVHYHIASMEPGNHSDVDKKRASLEFAETASREALTLFYKKKGDNGHLYMAKLLHGVILIKLRRFKLAYRELTQAMGYFTKKSSYMALCETRSALGLLCWEQHQPEQGQEYIITALTRTAHGGYERFSLMAPSDFVKVAILGICADRSDGLFNFFSSLLATHFSSHTHEQVIQLRSHPFVSGKSHWKRALKCIYTTILPRITITTLGQFSVLIGDQKVTETAWEGNRPKLLLKAIICNHSREITREKLIEDLWPDCSADVGKKNFKVNLHRLRNALESDVDKKMGYCYIKLNGGRVSLTPQLVTVDVEIFSHLLDQGYHHLAQDQQEAALPFFEKAVTLYGGDFFQEESSIPWITDRRGALKRDFIDLVTTLSRIYEKQKQPLKAARYLRMAIKA